MKKPFFITVDYGTGGTCFMVYAYSRQQIDRIFDQPKSKWIGVYEEGEFEQAPLYRFHNEHGLPFPHYDVDKPTEALKDYMIRNKVEIPEPD